MAVIKEKHRMENHSRKTGDGVCGGHFTYGLNFHKLLWIFVFGSIVGCVFEMLQCFFKYGYFERRSGLIFGPFNIVYGFGAVALCFCLCRIDKNDKTKIFLTGMAAGTMVEYICSIIQEALFGTVSWDYSSIPLNIDGRICLLCSLIWGILSLAWACLIYPCCEKFMLKIPNMPGRQFARLMFIFLIINAALSSAAVMRWAMRADGIPAGTAVGWVIDNRFPDAFMEVVYPNMKGIID